MSKIGESRLKRVFVVFAEITALATKAKSMSSGKGKDYTTHCKV